MTSGIIACVVVGCSIWVAGCSTDAGRDDPDEASSAAAALTSRPQPDAVCSTTCANGTVLSCSSTNCEGHDQYVVCNGAIQGCPCTELADCGDGTSVSCSGTAPNCEVFEPVSEKICGAVQCGGPRLSCHALPGNEDCF